MSKRYGIFGQYFHSNFLVFSNLQLGIRNVFEPGHADFSQMTTDENIYVTNIEQAVTVTIRNYMEAASPLTNNMKKRKYECSRPPLFFFHCKKVNSWKFIPGNRFMAGNCKNSG